jgi:hypothetical protein
VETASGNGEWKRRVETASGNGEWKRRVETASGNGEGKRRGETARGNSEGKQRGETASGNSDWKRRSANELSSQLAIAIKYGIVPEQPAFNIDGTVICTRRMIESLRDAGAAELSRSTRRAAAPVESERAR